MALQEAALEHLSHHALVEAGGVQVGRLLGLQQFGEHRLGRDHIAQAQARCQHLGERAQVDAALGVARRQRARRRVVEPQVAVGVVLDQRQVQCGGLLHQRGAARFAHGAACGVLEVGQHVQEARLVGAAAHLGGQLVHDHAFIVAGHSGHLRLHGREGLQRAQVGGCFHQHAAAGVDQHLGHQVQALLRAGGDQHLGRVHVPGQLFGNGLAQRAVALAGGVLQCGGAVVAQHHFAGLGKGIDREGLGRGQAASQADDAGLFSDLEDLADHRGVHLGGPSGQGPVGHCIHLQLVVR
jgi:hypothetical protein